MRAPVRVADSGSLPLQESVDRQFASSVGAIVVGSMLRERAVEADLAKLRFVGHVSHELRTPLHGCTSQIDLIREVSKYVHRPLPPRRSSLTITGTVCFASGIAQVGTPA